MQAALGLPGTGVVCITASDTADEGLTAYGVSPESLFLRDDIGADLEFDVFPVRLGKLFHLRR